LLERTLGELCAADSTRETQVIANERARPGLPTDRFAFDDERPQAFGRRIDGSRQTRRARADDRDVEVSMPIDPCTHSVRRRKLGIGGVDKHQPAARDNHRQFTSSET
jgi:hypothetical protein